MSELKEFVRSNARSQMEEQGIRKAWNYQQKKIDDLLKISKEQIEVINSWDSRATSLAWDNTNQAKKLFEQQKRIEHLESILWGESK